MSGGREGNQGSGLLPRQLQREATRQHQQHGRHDGDESINDWATEDRSKSVDSRILADSISASCLHVFAWRSRRDSSFGPR